MNENWIQKCKKFSREIIQPQCMLFDKENRFPDTIHRAAIEWNLVHQDFPKSLGGGGLPDTAIVKGAEILASSCAPSAFTLGFNRGALHPVVVAGTPEQKQRIIGDCITNNRYASLCLTEPDRSGSDLMNLQTTASKSASGWVISGVKSMVGNATVADYFLVLANVEENGRKKGLSFFVVPKDQRVIVGPNTDKLGFRAVETPQVTFQESLIPFENQISHTGSGAAIMMQTLAAIRLGGSAIICGLVRGALRDVLPWVEDRSVYGGRLIQKSHIQLQLGGIYGRLLSVRQEVLRCAQLRQDGHDYSTQASLAKLHAAELAIDATAQIVQMFGWRGIDNQYAIQKRYRDARQTTIFEGTSEVQKSNLFHLLWKNWREQQDV
jgi:alkylation response protein AidB-like acyl-CoA dehydrogenase